MKIELDLGFKSLFISMIITSVFLANGCSGIMPGTVKKISINGIDKYQEVSSEEPVKLDLNGINVTVNITKSTEVKKIDINGNDMAIILPEGANPEIDDNGIDTEIKYQK